MERTGADTGQSVEGLIEDQLKGWDLAAGNYSDLEKVRLRKLLMPGGCNIIVQFNPARMRSSAARVDRESLKERPCFLCRSNLPPQQKWVEFAGKYLILLNPYPIFQRHLTISLCEHNDQLIKGRFADMLRLAEALDKFTIFYNGPRCGASAPDHFHFQAGNKGFMPVEDEYFNFPRKLLAEKGNCRIESMDGYERYAIVLSGNDSTLICRSFEAVYGILHSMQKEMEEPMMNILAGFDNGNWRVFIFPRRAHRPAEFFEEGERQILISPASVDFGGVWITPRPADFEKLDPGAVAGIFEQVSLGKEQWEELIEKLIY